MERSPGGSAPLKLDKGNYLKFRSGVLIKQMMLHIFSQGMFLTGCADFFVGDEKDCKEQRQSNVALEIAGTPSHLRRRLRSSQYPIRIYILHHPNATNPEVELNPVRADRLRSFGKPIFGASQKAPLKGSAFALRVWIS